MRKIYVAIILSTFLTVCFYVESVSSAETEKTGEFKELTWGDLIPSDLTRADMRKGKSVDESKTFAIVYDEKIFSPVKELNGELIRMPGFILPLEFTGKKVTEMLLVPFVGACIHVPPPPPIQIVYVHIKEGYLARALYDAVWVEGRMSTTYNIHKLDYVDGEEDIQVGYSLKASSITPVNPDIKK